MKYFKFYSKIAYYYRYKGYFKLAKEYEENKKRELGDLENIKIKNINNAVNYAYNNSEFYKKIIPRNINIKSIKDLQKIKITTKSDLKNNYDDIINLEYLYRKGSTGGSTGQPLIYLMSKKDYILGLVNLNKACQVGGYEIGDKLLLIAGDSLVSNKKKYLKNLIYERLMNIRHFSSYGMTEQTMEKCVELVNRFKPKHIRGYASSLYILAKYIENNNLKITSDIMSIFSTSEKLETKQRNVIERVFNTKVFDQYGLNDGGISAFECECHNGFHIDENRAILEVVDENGNQIYDRPGRIIATTLFNKAMPFVRYDTGDIGILSSKKCICDSNKALLKNLLGRTTDYLEINGSKIGSPVLTVLMGKFDIELYQIIQKSNNDIDINIICGKNYNKKENELFISNSIFSHVGKCNIIFSYYETSLPFCIENKHKFIFRQ